MTLDSEIDESRLWLTSAVLAHRRWRDSSARFSEHTKEQYRSQFTRFFEWLSVNNLALATVKSSDIDRFLSQLTGRQMMPATPVTRRRYLGEVDRVMRHLVHLGLRSDNPAASVTRNPWQGRIKSYSVVIPDVEVAQLDRMFGRLLAQPTARATRWKDNKHLQLALAGLMLHGGLTPKEIQRLKVRDLKGLHSDSGFVEIEAARQGRIEPRSVRLGGWTVVALEHWCQELAIRLRLRLDDTVDGEHAQVLVFASPRGKQEVRDRPAMTTKSMWESVNALFEKVGLQGFVGPQSLRTLYIADLIRRGLPDHAVRLQAGLKHLPQVDAVRKALGVRRA